jgi:hypothetical protein
VTRLATTGGKATKARHRKAAKPERHAASATAPRGHSSNTDLQEQLDQYRKELKEALEQQTATSLFLANALVPPKL